MTNTLTERELLDVAISEGAAFSAECAQLQRELSAAQADIAALREDAERLEWALPILSGDDTPEATSRALKLAGAVLMQLSGRAAIDAARKS